MKALITCLITLILVLGSYQVGYSQDKPIATVSVFLGLSSDGRVISHNFYVRRWIDMEKLIFIEWNSKKVLDINAPVVMILHENKVKEELKS